MAVAQNPSRRLPSGGDEDNRAVHFSNRLAHLRTRLAPLVSVTDQTAHAEFPATLLQYHLLTSPQLDALAQHYHQSSPRVESWGYPVSVVGRWAVPSSSSPLLPSQPTTTTTTNSNQSTAHSLSFAIMGLEPDNGPTTGSGSGSEPASPASAPRRSGRGKKAKASVHDRRRRFGRFIGLRGCESPTLSAAEAMREEERYVDRWVEREAMRRARLRGLGGEKGLGLLY